jgi:hypothetical protein
MAFWLAAEEIVLKATTGHPAFINNRTK